MTTVSLGNCKQGIIKTAIKKRASKGLDLEISVDFILSFQSSYAFFVSSNE